MSSFVIDTPNATSISLVATNASSTVVFSATHEFALEFFRDVVHDKLVTWPLRYIYGNLQSSPSIQLTFMNANYDGSFSFTMQADRDYIVHAVIDELQNILRGHPQHGSAEVVFN